MEKGEVEEIWKPVVDYEDLYEVSSRGRVRSLERRVRTYQGTRRVRARILKPHVIGGGYLGVALSSENVSISRHVSHLVAEAFIGPRPPKMDVCHYDGVRTNDRIENLRYDTRAANLADRERHGTVNNGARNGKTKLTIDQVEQIRALKGEKSQSKIGRIFGVAQATVARIHSGRAWRDWRATEASP